MAVIAGHTFIESPVGVRLCSCGRKWTEIAGTTAHDVGASNIAHYGVLSETEYTEIAAERERMWSLTMSV